VRVTGMRVMGRGRGRVSTVHSSPCHAWAVTHGNVRAGTGHVVGNVVGVGRHAAGGRWRDGGGGTRAGIIQPAAWGVRPPAHLQEREVDNRPSRLGAPLLSQHELQPLARHLQVRGQRAAHTPLQGVPRHP
jgi:hypothetical protein